MSSLDYLLDHAPHRVCLGFVWEKLPGTGWNSVSRFYKDGRKFEDAARDEMRGIGE